MKRKKLIFDKIIFLFLIFLFPSINIIGAEGEANGLDSLFKTANIILLVFILFILWLVVVYSEKGDQGESFYTPLRKFRDYLTRLTPLENEKEILMAHDYDGIKELDNRIPPWFNFLFYGSILFGIIYMIHFHVIGSGEVQKEEYIEEVRLADAQREFLIRTGVFINEQTVTLLKDAASISSGKEIYEKNCASCHGMYGEGLIGPNLTDNYWIHGGGIQDIFKIIKYGVLQKGMISWQTQLDPKKIQETASYIMTLQGTNPPNAKQPEGDLYESRGENQI